MRKNSDCESDRIFLMIFELSNKFVSSNEFLNLVLLDLIRQRLKGNYETYGII